MVFLFKLCKSNRFLRTNSLLLLTQLTRIESLPRVSQFKIPCLTGNWTAHTANGKKAQLMIVVLNQELFSALLMKENLQQKITVNHQKKGSWHPSSMEYYSYNALFISQSLWSVCFNHIYRWFWGTEDWHSKHQSLHTIAWDMIRIFKMFSYFMQAADTTCPVHNIAKL